MQINTITIALILGLFSFWGCDENLIEPNAGSIIGSWDKQVEGQLVTLSFIDNGTYTFVFEGDVNEVTGTYTLSGDKITIIDDGNASEGGCSGIEGNYSYSIDGDELIFSLIADNCDGRSEGMPGTWTKK